MRRLMLSCLFISMVIIARSQVTIEQNRYVPMSFMAVNIFDVDLINPGTSSFNGYLKGRITQAGTGKVIAEAFTGLITINTGRTNLSSFALQPIFSYNDAYTESTGKLSFGNYEICVTLLGSNNEPLTVQCTGLNVTTISPPYLLSPPDRSSLNYKYPFLVWTLPGASADVRYKLVLSEIFPNQTAYDALANNFRIIDADGLVSNSLPYPSTALPLEKNKSYAWQVTAYNSSDEIGTTEVWSFQIVSDTMSADTSIISTNYIILNDIDLAGVYATKDRKLYLQLDEKYVAGNVTVDIFHNEDMKASLCNYELLKKVGMNLYTLKLDDCSTKLLKNDVYILQVKTNNQSYTLKFTLK